MENEQVNETGFCVDELARLPERALIDEGRLAGALDVNPRTIRRMIDRGELPPPAQLGNRKVWMPGRVLDHIAARLDDAEKEAAAEALRLQKYSA